MNFRYMAWVCLLLAAGAAGAQVASHAPTLAKPAADPAAAHPQAPMAASSTPVARVNGTVLTEADLVREEYAIFPYARQHNGLPKELEPEIRQGAMQMIIFEELVYQEALRRRMSVPAARMRQAESDFQKTFANPEDYNAFLQSEFHGSRQLLDEKIERSLLIDALLKIEVGSKSRVTPAEVRDYYDQNPDRFRIPESYIFQTISVLVPDHATPSQIKEARRRADDDLRQARSTRSNDEFGLLAERISDDDYRVMEGQHQSTPVSQLPPPIAKALGAMKAGDVSDVVQLGQDYTILRLNAHSPGGEEKFEDVKDKLAKDLERNKTNHLRAALDQRLRQKATIAEP